MGNHESMPSVPRPLCIRHAATAPPRHTGSLLAGLRVAAAGVETGFQTQAACSRQSPRQVSQRAVSTNRFPGASDVGLEHRRVDRLDPIRTPWRRTWVKSDRGRSARRPATQAGPRPILGPLNQTSTERAPLDDSNRSEFV
jgi:hypothetical protein